MNNFIALLTDFGTRGFHYVASMKGIILKINPEAKIIDISHNISSYSIIEAAYIIKSTYKYFPYGTVFIIVVDPGVGSAREIIAFKTKESYYFIGPNNGIFSIAFKKNKILECIEVINQKYFHKPISNTFHGRDIMAPVGAYITKGISLENFGPTFNLKKLFKTSIDYDVNYNEKIIVSTIQYIDSFGNTTTNIPIKRGKIKNSSLLLKNNNILKFQFKDKIYSGKFVKKFTDVPIRSLLFMEGSSGFLEISKNQGNAAKDLGFKVGDIITITL